MSCNSSNEKPYYDFETHFEISEGQETTAYQQTTQFYNNLAQVYSKISIQEIGKTDSGKPLHIVILNAESQFNFSKIRKNKRGNKLMRCIICIIMFLLYRKQNI
ncbi:hypothetical protein L3X37_02450 [Sabulilitoribacter arenilitoris]|uniref:Uncharacterized protein n=1 Tax=Wocania arenilitoris TaxID=2044858 RepID=A0AAE3EKK0_9FLAO|nr:hypothetical protein [Wocania arenilitoris]MCF7567226.1 hypothetical protein [Wocania arenilitoris]